VQPLTRQDHHQSQCGFNTFVQDVAAEDRRDADTWGVHLLDAAQQGLRPDHTIADAGQGLRAGQRAAWGFCQFSRQVCRRDLEGAVSLLCV